MNSRINIAVLILTIVFMGCSGAELPQQAYIDNLELYNEFQLTKELNQSITTVEQDRQAGLDSVELELKMLSRQIEMNKGQDENQVRLFQYKQSEYQMKNQQMQQDLSKINNDYNNQIWTRLNEYVSDYGKDNGYQIIFGGMGEGTVMFCDSSMNITDEIIAFVNQRYNGEK